MTAITLDYALSSEHGPDDLVRLSRRVERRVACGSCIPAFAIDTRGDDRPVPARRRYGSCKVSRQEVMP